VNKTINKSMLKGFTLLEIIVSLAISAILISRVVKLFTWLSDTQNSVNRKNSSMETLFEADGLITSLFSESDSVHYSDNKLTFYTFQDKTEEIEFENEYILINASNFVDTFYLSTKDVSVTFNRIAPRLVETVTVPVIVEKQIIKMKHQKSYSGEILVNSQSCNNEN